MIAKHAATSIGLTTYLALTFSPVHAMTGPDDDVTGSKWNDHFVVRAEENQSSETTEVSTGPPPASPWEYRLVEQRCSNSGANFCVAYACAEPDQVGYLVERRLGARPQDAWQPYDEVCVAPDGPEVTPGLILAEVRRVGLPSMSVEAPPETFVNYETVVYTDAESFTRTVNLLGFTVDIQATPSRFHWTYGDGTTETTTTAGRPYPATDITHTWTDAHRTYHPSVDVTYQIRYRVNNGDWQTLADTIRTQGPNTDVRIREATGMLTEMQ